MPLLKLVLEKMFSGEEFEFVEVETVSGVDDQPMTNKETLQGAVNRVESAQIQEADYWVGIEGGLEKRMEKWRHLPG